MQNDRVDKSAVGREHQEELTTRDLRAAPGPAGQPFSTPRINSVDRSRPVHGQPFFAPRIRSFDRCGGGRDHEDKLSTHESRQIERSAAVAGGPFSTSRIRSVDHSGLILIALEPSCKNTCFVDTIHSLVLPCSEQLLFGIALLG